MNMSAKKQEKEENVEENIEENIDEEVMTKEDTKSKKKKCLNCGYEKISKEGFCERCGDNRIE